MVAKQNLVHISRLLKRTLAVLTCSLTQSFTDVNSFVRLTDCLARLLFSSATYTVAKEKCLFGKLLYFLVFVLYTFMCLVFCVFLIELLKSLFSLV